MATLTLLPACVVFVSCLISLQPLCTSARRTSLAEDKANSLLEVPDFDDLMEDVQKTLSFSKSLTDRLTWQNMVLNKNKMSTAYVQMPVGGPRLIPHDTVWLSYPLYPGVSLRGKIEFIGQPSIKYRKGMPTMVAILLDHPLPADVQDVNRFDGTYRNGLPLISDCPLGAGWLMTKRQFKRRFTEEDNALQLLEGLRKEGKLRYLDDRDYCSDVDPDAPLDLSLMIAEQAGATPGQPACIGDGAAPQGHQIAHSHDEAHSHVEGKDACPICLNDFEVQPPTEEDKRFIKLPCGHFFHRPCLLNWFKTKFENEGEPICPMCRAKASLEWVVQNFPIVNDWISRFGLPLGWD